MKCLPDDGILTGLMTVQSDNDISLDEATESNQGPTEENLDNIVYNNSSEMGSFLPVGEQQQQERCN